MNTYRIDFNPKTDVELNDEIEELIWDYFGCLYKNGQILDNHEVIKSETELFAYVTPPLDEALDEENNRIVLRTDRCTDPKSQLAERGREICQAFQEETGKPFYYYIFNYLRFSKTCTIFGSDWL